MVEYNDLDLGQRQTYAYDALGRRIARVVDADGAATGPTETRYFYDAWQVCEEQDGAGVTQATYVYGMYIDEVLNMQRGGSNFFYHTDDLYNVMAVTDATGTVTERYEYADYGQPIDPTTLNPIVGDPSAIGNPYLFTGRRYDPETGWYYYRTRYLDPVAGRFTTRDIVGIWTDIGNLGNGYTYVWNNPATSRDPLGQEPECKVNIVCTWIDVDTKRIMTAKNDCTRQSKCSCDQVDNCGGKCVDTYLEVAWYKAIFGVKGKYLGQKAIVDCSCGEK